MDNSNENAIEWLRGDKNVTLTLAGNSRICNRIKKLASECPDEVKIVSENQDGSILAHMPLSYLKITKPREMSESQKNNAREIAKNNFNKGEI